MTYETGRATNVEGEDVASRDDFADLVLAMLEDFRHGGEAEWENGTLGRFLDGLAAIAADRPFHDDDQDAPTWLVFAKMMVGQPATNERPDLMGSHRSVRVTGW